MKKTLVIIAVLTAMLAGLHRVFCGEGGLWFYYPNAGKWYLAAPYSSSEVGTTWE